MADLSAPTQLPAGLFAPAPLSGGASAHGPVSAMQDDRIRAVAEQFEAAYLAEMLRYSGLGKMPDSFNGGAGEAAFAGTLVQEYANRIAATGALGIADRIYDTLSERAVE